MSLPNTDADGVVQTVSDGTPVSWNAGLGYDSAGKLCVTSVLSPSDVYIRGRRVAANGALVVIESTPEAKPFDYNAGWPTSRATGAVITQSGTPSPTDPRVAGIAIGPLGGVYMTSGGYIWTPADMPSLGAWFDPSDLSTMFQDAAGTTPVTAAGQPVGLILDKSGNGYHASQPTSTARPLFQIDGSGNCYLAFDGVDDSLSTSAIDMTGTDKVTVFEGKSSLSTSGIQISTEFSTNSDSTSGSFGIASPVVAILDYFQLNGTSRVNVGVVDAAYVNPKTIVVSCEFDISGSGILTEIFPRVNGVVPPLQSGAGSAGTGNFGNHPLFIGSRAGSSYFFNGNIYSLIIGGAAYDAATVLAAEAWVADKTGVTL